LKVKGGTLVVISGQVAWDVQGHLVEKVTSGRKPGRFFEKPEEYAASAGRLSGCGQTGHFFEEREDFTAFREIRASTSAALILLLPSWW